MGTNFYIRGHRNDMAPTCHIGRRSAAGQFCWDCGLTLYMYGESGIHSGRSKDWHQSCPECGAKPGEEKLETSSVGRELGFNKGEPRRKVGVATCSSFSWAMSKEALNVATNRSPTCPSCGADYPDPDKVIEDEYGNLYTRAEFDKVLEECPIQYTDNIGQYFS